MNSLRSIFGFAVEFKVAFTQSDMVIPTQELGRSLEIELADLTDITMTHKVKHAKLLCRRKNSEHDNLHDYLFKYGSRSL